MDTQGTRRSSSICLSMLEPRHTTPGKDAAPADTTPPSRPCSLCAGQAMAASSLCLDRVGVPTPATCKVTPAQHLWPDHTHTPSKPFLTRRACSAASKCARGSQHQHPLYTALPHARSTRPPSSRHLSLSPPPTLRHAGHATPALPMTVCVLCSPAPQGCLLTPRCVCALPSTCSAPLCVRLMDARATPPPRLSQHVERLLARPCSQGLSPKPCKCVHHSLGAEQQRGAFHAHTLAAHRAETGCAAAAPVF